MTYCKDYCEEKGISTSKLNEAQKTLYYIAENMKMGKSINEEGYKHFQMAIKALEQEPCEDVAKERYEDLCEYFGEAKSILNSREEFKKWLDRVKWYIRKTEELYEKYEYKQEPYEDKIIEWKNDFKGFINELSMPKDDYNGIMEYIDEVPNEARWIPVSERLPEDYRRVLVSDVMGVYIGEFVDAEENWGGKHFINEHGMHSKSVKAWMPLPEPYKESEG